MLTKSKVKSDEFDKIAKIANEEKITIASSQSTKKSMTVMANNKRVSYSVVSSRSKWCCRGCPLIERTRFSPGSRMVRLVLSLTKKTLLPSTRSSRTEATARTRPRESCMEMLM
jgi:hypothetical protein